MQVIPGGRPPQAMPSGASGAAPSQGQPAPQGQGAPPQQSPAAQLVAGINGGLQQLLKMVAQAGPQVDNQAKQALAQCVQAFQIFIQHMQQPAGQSPAPQAPSGPQPPIPQHAGKTGRPMGPGY